MNKNKNHGYQTVIKREKYQNNRNKNELRMNQKLFTSSATKNEALLFYRI